MRKLLSTLDGAAGCEELLPAAELDARAAMRLPGGALREVDRLPARVQHRLESALGEHLLERPLLAGRQEPSLRIVEQLLDGLGRVLLVRADHPGRASLDPAGAVHPRQR